jgi:hypothetical protein
MKPLTLLMLATLVALALPGLCAKRALIVGVNEYEHCDALSGSVNDTAIMSCLDALAQNAFCHDSPWWASPR